MRLQDAADALGVHYQTAYGWVRSGQLPARKVRRGYEVTEADVQAFAAARLLGQEPISQIKVRDWPSQADKLFRAIAAGQETQARRTLDRLVGHVEMTDLCDRVLGPALRRVGDEWEAGRLSIAHEHRATAICERLIAAHSSQPSGRPRGTAVVTTPQDERHGMPALMAAACLRGNHWHVHHLAADLPPEEISRLASQVGADLVVLSTASAGGAASAELASRAVRAAVPDATILVGHPGEKLLDLVCQARSITKLPAPT
jgi:excisionase family DNA binding protein